MRRLGKLVIMTDKEHKAQEKSFQYEQDSNMGRGLRISELIYANRDLSAAVVQMRDTRRAERKVAFTAGKFHAAGGYAHALKETRLKLQGTTAVMLRFMDLAAKWRPLVEALESYPNQFVEISFDAGMHFPVKRWNKDGTEYLASVRYQDKEYPDHQAATLSELAHDDDVSDADAAADFDVVGTSVAAERRRA